LNESVGITPDLFFIVAIFAIGMALSFFVADPGSPPTRALASALSLIGISMLLNVPLEAGLVQSSGRAWVYTFSLLEAAIVIASLEWMLRIASTETRGTSRWFGREVLAFRIGQSLAAVYGVAGVFLPKDRLTVWQRGLFERPVFTSSPYRSSSRWPSDSPGYSSSFVLASIPLNVCD
jgi:peptidoglycan biosynthesis protein MviN/MurJ (putative lipid II flippase)